MGPLIVGYDGTPGARVALAEADRLAGELDTGVVVVFCSPISRLGGEVRDYEDAVREHGRAQLAEARRMLSREPELVMLERPPAEGLIEAAEEHDARMIVVGCYGERPLKSALVGSTPTRLLHLSERPVLAVRVAVGRGGRRKPTARVGWGRMVALSARRAPDGSGGRCRLGAG